MNTKNTITFKEFKTWLTTFIVDVKKGELPGVDDWREIKNMLDRVEVAEETDVKRPKVTENYTGLRPSAFDNWFSVSAEEYAEKALEQSWINTVGTCTSASVSDEKHPYQMGLDLNLDDIAYSDISTCTTANTTVMEPVLTPAQIEEIIKSLGLDKK